MAKREGPRLRVDASCFDCTHCQSEHEAVQGDSGHRVYCVHPTHDAPKRIGWSTWQTPDWCPLLAAATAKLAAGLSEKEEIRGND